ncbi:Protein lethal(2)essential for life [Armadillidium nasatum]|uniref:Protein lethal(2)essential for life n=1 Tax=Armadillidium nasatum TaxID=96803 RepID=A0A5N5TK29_9CRUS|nr:Protein lethal(2)essential for life [Armadillidium nasatum]
MSTTTKTTKTTKTLTVVRRETFYDDSFFEDSWGDFDSAIKRIVQKFETDSTPKIDFGNRNVCTDVYRKIRTSNIEKDLYQSQALEVTEKEGKFQCVMDVKDFTPNDLQVKVVEDRVVVEGKFEKKSEDGSSTVSKSFHKEFTLPNAANIELVSTALSKDGVLTIKAPKRVGTEVANPSGTQTSSTQTSSVEQKSSKTADGSSTSSVVQTSSKKESFSSTSSFSSTKKISSTSSFDSSKALTDDVSQNIQDRLVFTHDNVNIKLPATK